MQLAVLVLAFSSCFLHWPIAVSAIVCEAVQREGSSESALCQRVNDCIGVTPAGEGVDAECIRETNACITTTRNDGGNVSVINGTNYFIHGLHNFIEDSSHVGYCPSIPNPDKIYSDYGWNSGGCTPPGEHSISTIHVIDLSVSYNPIDTHHYTMNISWAYPDSAEDELFDGTRVFRLYVVGPGITYPDYCVCINSTMRLTEYSLVLEYPQSTFDQFSISMVTFPHTNQRKVKYGPYVILDPISPPEDCSDHDSGLPYDRSRCNKPYFGKPRNVRVNETETHTTLSWDKPCYVGSNACDLLESDSSTPESGPNTYYLATTVNNLSDYFIIYNTTEITLSTTHLEDFKLYTQTPCSGECEDDHFANGCSEPATYRDTIDNSTKTDQLSTVDSTCCVPEITTTTAIAYEPTSTSIPTTKTQPKSSGTNRIMIYAPLCAVVVLALVVVAVIMLVTTMRSRRFRTRVDPLHACNDTDSSALPSPALSQCPVSVLVVYSPRTSELESHTILQYLVGDLTASPRGIIPTAYGMDQLRLSPTEWIVQQHREASAVLCVCNREFFEDWSDFSTSDTYNPKIIRTLKRLFEGDLQQQESSSTNDYAVILMKNADSRYIPSLLKSRPAFMCDQTDEIARFAHNEPTHIII